MIQIPVLQYDDIRKPIEELFVKRLGENTNLRKRIYHTGHPETPKKTEDIVEWYTTMRSLLELDVDLGHPDTVIIMYKGSMTLFSIHYVTKSEY